MENDECWARNLAPSMRPKAIRFPDGSKIDTFCGTPISPALAIAAASASAAPS